MKTIYNTYVVMESQEQCDRMKQLCIDNGLPIWRISFAFDFFIKSKNVFSFSEKSNEFFIYDFMDIDDQTQITEQEFIELLKTSK